MTGIGDFHRKVKCFIDKSLSIKIQKIPQAMIYVGE